MNTEIYLDHAASTPVDPVVAEAMADCLRDVYANPASSHPPGRRAMRLVEEARQRVAARIGAAAGGIVFTSGATEANNLALQGVLAAAGSAAKRPHLVTTRIEHPSVLETARALSRRGVDVTYLDCDAGGFVAPERVAEAIREETVLVSVMHVNNEVGTVQDIAAIAACCRERGVPLHVDAAQSVGKLPLDARAWGVSLVSTTAHKLCGPKGVGALYVAPNTALRPLFYGGEQEGGLRPGTLATHQIVGTGKAYELADPEREGPRLAALRDALWTELREIAGVRLNGDPTRLAPHVLNVAFPGAEGESLRLALADLAVSAGSACASDTPEPSHVLSGMGLSDALAGSSLRFSVGRTTREADVRRAAGRVVEEVARLRALAGPAPAWCST
jgi:cysteine desulfurase